MHAKKFLKILVIMSVLLNYASEIIYAAQYGSPQEAASGSETEFIKGVDVSFIPQKEDYKAVFKDGGKAKDPLQIFKDHGINYIRLKLWHTPVDGYNSLEKILAMARRIKEKQLGFLLNFHYSDTWADPGKQIKPAAWTELSFPDLRDSLYNYTYKVIDALKRQGTLPQMVQVGNEITPGMLWEEGRVGGEWETEQQWHNFTDLLKAGIKAINDVLEPGEEVKIMIHIDRGGDNAASRWFFDNLLRYNVQFDIIGLSYYPWWHGTMQDLIQNLNDLAIRYDKDINVVETAYPWTLQWFERGHNIVGDRGQLHEGYPASVSGQYQFLKKLIQIVKEVPNNRGNGIFYWAPEHIYVSPLRTPWENNALFDFTGEVLPSIRAFETASKEVTSVNVTIRLNTSTNPDTLNASHFAQIRGMIQGQGAFLSPDSKIVSWHPGCDLVLHNVGGDNWEVTFRMFSGDTLFYKFWTGFSRTKGTSHWNGWEGHIDAGVRRWGNNRIFIAGDTDTTLALQYYNGTDRRQAQYWRPAEE
jgi:arabinogalactan endo-1,4-beta-galactosidase